LFQPSTLEPLESRRLLTVLVADPTFGSPRSSLLSSLSTQDISNATPRTMTVNDGRLVTVDRGVAHFLRGNGDPDPKRGSGGLRTVYRGATPNLSVAVDPATGRLAVIDIQGNTLDLYNSKGRRVATTRFNSGDNQSHAVSFTPDGGLVVANGTMIGDPMAVDYRSLVARVYRYDASLHPVASFGTNGVAQFTYVDAAHAVGGYHYVHGAFVDSSGAIAVVIESTSNLGPEAGKTRFETSLDVLHLAANGMTASATTHVDVGQFISDRFDTVDAPFAYVDAAMIDDGSLVIVAEHGDEHLRLHRIATDGTVTHRDLDGGRANGMAGEVASLAYSSGSSVYVATRNLTNVVRVYRIDALTLADVDGWGSSGTTNYASLTTRMSSFNQLPRLTAEANGRLLTTGYGENWTGDIDLRLTAYTGASDTFDDVSAGAARLLADGTLLIKGTDGNDDVSIGVGIDPGLLRLVLNQKTQSFDLHDIRSVAVLLGDGDDSFSTTNQTESVDVYGGAGNDTIAGSDGADVLFGGAGDDLLTGGINPDALYGEDGNDTLFAGEYFDFLYGGRGNDFLQSSGDFFNEQPYDGFADRLVGNSGKDGFQLDDLKANHVGSQSYQLDDIVVDATAEDRVRVPSHV
jgi:Ca2+-binding RTX toxin-like protein